VTDRLRVTLAQIASATGALDSALEAHLSAIRTAREAGAELIVFPELSLSGYLVEDTSAFAENTPELLVRLSNELVNETVVVGAPWLHSDGSVTNATFVVDATGLLHRHDKIYLPEYGGFSEHLRFSKGDKVRVLSFRSFRLGLLVCEDAWHAALPYLAALQGADLIVIPAASATGGVSASFDSAAGWEAVNRACALLYSTYVLYCNFAGRDQDHLFSGRSGVTAPDGTIHALAAEPDVVLTTTLARDLVDRQRAAMPTLDYERIDVTLNELRRIQV